MSKDCVFCQIIKGEIPSMKVYEDDNFIGILDIFPASKGHVIIISKNHIENVFELDDETASGAFIAAKKISNALTEGIGCEGINILQNNNKIAGQTVFHFHIHIIPRYQDDTITFSWKSGKYEEHESEEVIKALKDIIY